MKVFPQLAGLLAKGNTHHSNDECEQVVRRWGVYSTGLQAFLKTDIAPFYSQLESYSGLVIGDCGERESKTPC